MKDKLNRWVLAVLMALSGLVLGGCKAETEETTSGYALPPELKDCKIYRLINEDGNGMYIARCPNSSTTTTYRSGKSNQTSVVIDGTEAASVSASGS